MVHTSPFVLVDELLELGDFSSSVVDHISSLHVHTCNYLIRYSYRSIARQRSCFNKEFLTGTVASSSYAGPNVLVKMTSFHESTLETGE